MAMVPHERSLVERFQNKPFALLGVNADRSVGEFRRVQEEKQINWRSWWDGNPGRISSRFQVQGFPSLFLLDHNGVIRNASVGRPRDSDLENAIERLIREAEEDGNRKTTADARTLPSGES
jgi:hypothetical protein